MTLCHPTEAIAQETNATHRSPSRFLQSHMICWLQLCFTSNAAAEWVQDNAMLR
jgi:hypothetical protein